MWPFERRLERRPNDGGAAPHNRPQLAALLIAELPRLRRYATAWLGNAADADDLVQDCVRHALQDGQGPSDVMKLRPWLLSILHERRYERPRGRLRPGRPTGWHRLDDDLLNHGSTADIEPMRDLLDALAALPEEQRQMLLLIGLENLSYQEAAEALNVPIGTVMSRLLQGRERLRLLLQPPPEVIPRPVGRAE